MGLINKWTTSATAAAGKGTIGDMYIDMGKMNEISKSLEKLSIDIKEHSEGRMLQIVTESVKNLDANHENFVSNNLDISILKKKMEEVAKNISDFQNSIYTSMNLILDWESKSGKSFSDLSKDMNISVFDTLTAGFDPQTKIYIKGNDNKGKYYTLDEYRNKLMKDSNCYLAKSVSNVGNNKEKSTVSPYANTCATIVTGGVTTISQVLSSAINAAKAGNIKEIANSVNSAGTSGSGVSTSYGGNSTVSSNGSSSTNISSSTSDSNVVITDNNKSDNSNKNPVKRTDSDKKPSNSNNNNNSNNNKQPDNSIKKPGNDNVNNTPIIDTNTDIEKPSDSIGSDTSSDQDNTTTIVTPSNPSNSSTGVSDSGNGNRNSSGVSKNATGVGAIFNNNGNANVTSDDIATSVVNDNNASDLPLIDDLNPGSSAGFDDIIHGNGDSGKGGVVPGGKTNPSKSSGFNPVPLGVGLGLATAGGVGAKVIYDHKKNSEFDNDEQEESLGGNKFWTDDEFNVINSEEDAFSKDELDDLDNSLNTNRLATEDYSASYNNDVQSDIEDGTWKIDDSDFDNNEQIVDLLNGN